MVKFGNVACSLDIPLDSPVEVVWGLVAIQNLDMRGLLADLKMGGFPAPSIAIVSTKASSAASLAGLRITR